MLTFFNKRSKKVSFKPEATRLEVSTSHSSLLSDVKGSTVTYSSITPSAIAVVKRGGVDAYIKLIAHWLVKIHWNTGRGYCKQDVKRCAAGLSYHLNRSKLRSGEESSLYSVLDLMLKANPLYDKQALFSVMRDCFGKKTHVQTSHLGYLTSLTLDWHLASISKGEHHKPDPLLQAFMKYINVVRSQNPRQVQWQESIAAVKNLSDDHEPKKLKLT